MDDETTTSAEQLILNIVGERVALGPLRRELIPLYQRWRNDFQVQRTFGDPPMPVTLERRTQWFEDQLTASDCFWFTIYAIERDGDVVRYRPIGTTDLFNVDFRFKVGQFGMMIGEADARGRGLGTEVVRLMLDFAFTALGLNNVMLAVAEYNLAGRRAYAKAGFKEMGRRRRADIMNGTIYDEIYMDAISEEFESPLLAAVFAPDVPR